MNESKDNNKKLTIKDFTIMKEKGEKFAVTTAYDYNMARMLDEAGIEILGTGSAGATMILGGKLSTVTGTMEDALFFLKLLCPGVKRAHIWCGMPFGSYQVSSEQAVQNAITLMKAGADSVKVEGAGIIADRINSINNAGIPVSGHLGLTPQYISKIGGYRSVGRKVTEAVQLYKDSLLLQEAGAWSIELECVPYRVAEVISKKLKIPTIGTGSGNGCDGQALISHDILGFQRTISPSFSKEYVNLWDTAVDAFNRYRSEVKAGQFPPPEKTIPISEDDFNRFLDLVG